MSNTITKATFRDLESQADASSLGWLSDRDENYLYFTKWVWEEESDSGTDQTKRYDYTWSEGKLAIDVESAVTVLRTTDYIKDSDPVGKELGVIKNMLSKLLNKTEVIKQFNDKTFTIVEPLYTPFGSVDGHGDGYKDENGPHDLVKSFEANKDTIQKAINHEHKTECFDIVKAWVNTKEATLGGITVAPLQPLVELKYTEKAYNLRKAGKLLGPSIGCSAWTEDVIKSLKDEMKVEPKRLLSEFDFSQKRHHLSLTTPSVGGPASCENWFIDMNKSMKTPEDLALLEELGEEFTDLEKKLQSVSDQEEAPSTSGTLEAQDAGVDKETLNKGNETTMSDNKEVNELAELRKQVAVMQSEKDLAKYSFDAEVSKGVAEALVDVTDKVAVFKALDVLVARVTEAVEAKATIEKSLEGKEIKEPTKLEKALAEAEGQAGDEGIAPSDELTDDILKQYREKA